MDNQELIDVSTLVVYLGNGLRYKNGTTKF